MLGGSAFCEVFLSKSAKPPGEVAKVGFAAWKERDLRRTIRIRKEAIYIADVLNFRMSVLSIII